MVGNFAYSIFLNLPVVAWGGIVTLILLLASFTIAYASSKGKKLVPFVWHRYLGIATVVSALIHGSIALLALLGY